MILHGIAWFSSLAVLVMLRVESIPPYIALWVVVSYFMWFFAYKVASKERLVEPADPTNDSFIENTGSPVQVSPHHGYFNRLLTSLERNWVLCDADLDSSQTTLKNVHASLTQAIDMAKSTGLLALNSMASATNTGEVGRGFVTVSKDLVSISDQSSADLAVLKNVVAKAESKLVVTRTELDVPFTDYLQAPTLVSIKGLIDSLVYMQISQNELRDISERYQKNTKADVRWLQLGDAVRRLLNEVINVLYQLELRLTDVISDMRLLQLSGTLNPGQLVEFKGTVDVEGNTNG
jgi:hypothetical protein